jgi:outer membrane immunogenic protein
MKRHHSIACVFAGLLLGPAGGALAADLEGMPAIWSAEAAREGSPFAGGYIGATAGYSFGGADTWQRGDSPVYSAMAGYNFVNGRFVYGLEAEVMRGSLGATALNGQANVSTFLDYQATARARAGFLFTPSLLLYGKLGASYAGMTFTDTATSNAASSGFYGWTTGVGAEWKMTDHVGLRLDYDFNSFAANSVTFPASTSTFKPQFNTLRLGVTVKF